jgi:hypothetical protein
MSSSSLSASHLLTESNQAAKDRTARRVISWALIAVTLLPMASVLFLSARFDMEMQSSSDLSGSVQALGILLVLARGHVGMTAALYFDRGFRPVIRKHPLRFIVLPIALLTLVPVVLMLSELALRITVFFTIAFNLWHFQKQNYGVLTLISVESSRPTPSVLQKRILDCACLFAIASYLPMQLMFTMEDAWNPQVVEKLQEWLSWPTLWMAAYAGLLGLAGFDVVRRRDAFVSRNALFYFAAIALFGLLVLAPGDRTTMTLGAATAHGLQYIILIYCVSHAAGRLDEIDSPSFFGALAPGAGKRKWLGAAIASAALITWALFWIGALPLLENLEVQIGSRAPIDWLAAFAATSSLAHFIIDGGAFRLREQLQRDWARNRIPLLMR